MLKEKFNNHNTCWFKKYTKGRKENQSPVPIKINYITSLVPTVASGESQWKKNYRKKENILYLTLMFQELLSCHAAVLFWTVMRSFIENYSAGREDLIKRGSIAFPLSSRILLLLFSFNLVSVCIIHFWFSYIHLRLELNNFIKGQWTIVQFSHTHIYFAMYVKDLTNINSYRVWFLFQYTFLKSV